MSPYQEEDIVNSTLELLSATSTWLLVRHQWLIHTMRCVLTGENTQPLATQYEFDRLVPKDLKLPKHLIERFAEITTSLETTWKKTAKASHPMSGLTIFEQLNNYQALAHQFMLASTEANQKLIHEFAMRDPLTGARTRLTLTACLSRELSHAERYKTPCTILRLDLGNLECINNHWGDATADQVITKTATIIQENLRPTDKLFKLGNVEWLILMPSTTKVEAKRAAERIKEIYATQEFKSTADNNLLSTLTYGIAGSNNQTAPEQWVNEADRQLSINKKES